MDGKALHVLKDWLNHYKSNILLKRISTVLIIDILVKLSGVVLLPVYLRLMTQAEYGLYAYLLSIILTFSVILNFGLYIPLSKYYHDYRTPEKRSALLFTIASLLLFFLACVIAPLYIFGLDYEIVKILFKNPINYADYRGVVLLAMIVSVLNFMLTSYFFTSEKINELKRYNIYRIVFINLAAILLLYFIHDKDSIKVRLEATYAVELIVFLFFLSFYLKEMRIDFDKKTASAGLKLAIPVMISAIYGIFINFSDKFFLEKYSSFKDLSYYYLAVSCASAIPLIYASLQNAWLPLFLKEKDIRINVARTKKMTIRMILGFMGISVLIVIFLKIILELGIIQMKYYEVIYILPILLFSQILSALVSLQTNYLIYFERTHMASITGLILCIVSVALSMVFIPRYKVYGAAAVSVVTNGIYLCLYYVIIRTYIKKHLLSYSTTE